jgi:nucleoid-associated protein YgaU
MAIFNFVKQAGAMLSDGMEKAADAVTAASEADVKAKIEASNLNPKDLALKKLDDDTMKVYAVVGSAEEKEELILLIGNSPGVAKVEDAIKVRGADGADASTPAPKFYQVQSGDTLSAIAQSQLGDSGRYMEIFNANRNTLSNPDAIDVGQTLRIPQ